MNVSTVLENVTFNIILDTIYNACSVYSVKSSGFLMVEWWWGGCCVIKVIKKLTAGLHYQNDLMYFKICHLSSIIEVFTTICFIYIG